MKKLKYGMPMLIVAILACTGFWLLADPRRTCPVKLVCLSITDTSTGGQLALFSLSNCTSREVVYMGREGSQPCYSLMQYIRLDPHNILGTNYNQDHLTNARQATLWGHSSLSFEVYVPSGVTGAVLSIDYQKQMSPLEEKARSFVESYGRQLPSRNPWTTLEVRQPFSDQAHQQ